MFFKMEKDIKNILIFTTMNILIRVLTGKHQREYIMVKSS